MKKDSATMNRLSEAAPSADTIRLLEQFLEREENPLEGINRFLKEVDDSDEPLEEWLQAFEILAYYLESTPHRPSLSTAIGYLHCCQAVSHTGARYATFPMTVETMLETYGYSGEER
ncbi:MAG TPA: hypothetical protein VK995_05135 [Oceanipulchritudo sp.]|nr:hypothetical protein [Oceanipulchritudo sp.]